MGNVNWMRARESQLASELFGLDLQKVMPIVRPGGSDSATFDNVLELLMLAGRSLPHAVMMMIPEAYADRDDLPDHLKGFYAFHSCLMEPWDGPAAVCFTDGTVVGATLDRNGLRPGRWCETKDGWVVLGSETGMLRVEPEEVKRLGRLAPGKLFLVDLEAGPHRRRRGGQAATSPPQRPYGTLVRREPRAVRRPSRAGRLAARPAAARAAAGLRLLAGGPARAHGARWPSSGEEPHRLDGQRHGARGPLRPAPAAVQLLQAALRAGDQPADRPDPRVDRHVAGAPASAPRATSRRVAQARAPARR